MQVNHQSVRRIIRYIDVPHMLLAVAMLALTKLSMRTPVNPMFIPPNDASVLYPKSDSHFLTKNTLEDMLFIATLSTIAVLYIASVFLDGIVNRFNIFTGVWMCLITIGLSNSFCAFFKGYVGWPRPDTYTVCGVNTTYATCKYKKRDKQFISWPSTHSTLAMSYSTYLSLFVQKAIKQNFILVDILCILPFFFGFYVGSTRIKDYKHHPDDVTAGLLIGSLVPFFLWKTQKKIIFREKKEQKHIEHRKDESESDKIEIGLNDNNL